MNVEDGAMKELRYWITIIGITIMMASCKPATPKTYHPNQEPTLIKKNSTDLVSPGGQYKAYFDSGTDQDLAKLLIVDLNDSSVIYQEQNYFSSAKWLKNDVLRIYYRPEIIKKDNRSNYFVDYDVSNRKKINTNQSIEHK